MWVIGVLLTGCVADVGDEAGSPPGLVGDWFPCEDEACASIADDGMRFRANGSMARLDTPGGPIAIEPICTTVDAELGNYVLDATAGRLTLVQQGDSMELGIELDADRLLLQDVPAFGSHGDDPPPMDIRMRRVLTDTQTRCEDNDPPPMATPISG